MLAFKPSIIYHILTHKKLQDLTIAVGNDSFATLVLDNVYVNLRMSSLLFLTRLF